MTSTGIPRVEVWRIDLDSVDADVERAAGLLPGRERASIEGIPEPHRRRKLLMRAATRVVLSSYVGTAARDLDIIREPCGRPLLVGGGPSFSVSSRPGCGLLAVSPFPRLGVDVEAPVPLTDVMAIAGRFFDPVELDLLSTMGEPGRERAFLRLWTAKEAHAKATGHGIAAGLTRVVLREMPRAGEAATVRDREGVLWTFQPLDLGPQHVGTLAVGGQPGSFTWALRRFDVVALSG